MFSWDTLRLIAEEREREIRDSMRIRALLEQAKRAVDDASADDPDDRYPEAWRTRAPRASATTR
jgi:hypothetical protein